MKLTVELIARTDSYLNPLKDRELDLRGLKIPAIENLGATKDSIDSLDLSDNAILSLSNLPRLTRLQTLNLANNPITTISPNIAHQLPNLRSLVLTGTDLKDLQSLSPLFNLRKLEFLSLQSSPVTQVPNYRTWLPHNIPSLRYLDFAKVKQQERDAAQKLYVEAEGKPTQLAQTMTGQSAAANGEGHRPAKTFEVGGASNGSGGAATAASRGLTEEQKQRVRKAIENAGTLEEIQRLKRLLADGFVPDDKTLKALGGK